MTHEQKPESAEFRTREDQADWMAKCITASGDHPSLPGFLREHLRQAEARGAVEQRRKDAKVKPSKPSAYIHTMYYSGERGNKPQKRLSFSSEKEAVFGEKGVDYDPAYLVRVKSLYARPANVAALEAERDKWKQQAQYETDVAEEVIQKAAALEARVKELEVEVERLKTPDWYISQEEEDGADSIADLMECHDPWEIIEIDGSRIVQKVWAFIDAEGEIRQFGTKEDAQSDIAAIREGGEHV